MCGYRLGFAIGLCRAAICFGTAFRGSKALRALVRDDIWLQRLRH